MNTSGTNTIHHATTNTLHPMQPLRPASQISSASCTSTSNLVAHDGSPPRKLGFWASLRGKAKRKVTDAEKNRASQESDCESQTSPFQGWKVIFLGSWLNILMFLIPGTWILRLATPDSDTIIFCSCILAMVPLVKLHDLSVRELSVRMGGSRTGLLNASMSNIVECVIAIIALRKCELRVVQSSLVGSMLSKLLLIMGMCFFSGGMRFTQQEFDCTATQIHSSLLSLSVGAVLLPAAFHFTLTYRSGETPGTSLSEQKQDILRMSHGVSIILLFIYISYLFFQFWSHSHHFRDILEPSKELPNAVSVRTMASRVRVGSPLRKIISPTPTYVTEFRSPRLTSPEVRKGQGYTTYRGDTTQFSPPPDRSTIAVPGSTFTNSSQSTIVAPQGSAGIRLVTDSERRGPSDDGSSSDGGSPTSCWGGSQSGSERDSFVPDAHLYPGDTEPREGGSPRLGTQQCRSRIVLQDGPVPQREPRSDARRQREPELSWFLTLTLLTVVTVLVAVNAEWMIDSIDGLSPTISKEWIGLILLPTVGCLAECVTAMNASAKDQLTLSVSVAVGSTIQLALFVIPFMIILGWILGKPLALLFDPFESIVLYISVHTMNYVVADGKSNWLEGIILIGLYVVAAVTFWFYPGSNFSASLAVCYTSKF